MPKGNGQDGAGWENAAGAIERGRSGSLISGKTWAAGMDQWRSRQDSNLQPAE
jgi:hypothetical protein